MSSSWSKTHYKKSDLTANKDDNVCEIPMLDLFHFLTYNDRGTYRGNIGVHKFFVNPELRCKPTSANTKLTSVNTKFS